jgi:hypothetical protein
LNIIKTNYILFFLRQKWNAYISKMIYFAQGAPKITQKITTCQPTKTKREKVNHLVAIPSPRGNFCVELSLTKIEVEVVQTHSLIHFFHWLEMTFSPWVRLSSPNWSNHRLSQNLPEITRALSSSCAPHPPPRSRWGYHQDSAYLLQMQFGTHIPTLFC